MKSASVSPAWIVIERGFCGFCDGMRSVYLKSTGVRGCMTCRREWTRPRFAQLYWIALAALVIVMLALIVIGLDGAQAAGGAR